MIQANHIPIQGSSTAADMIRDCQRRVIGSIVQAPGAELPPKLRRILDFAPEGFDAPEIGQIALAIRKAASNGTVPDLVSIGKHLSGENLAALSQLANDPATGLPLALVETEAVALLETIQYRRTVATLEEALSEARSHPTKTSNIAKHTVQALEEVADEPIRKPMVEFFKPSQLSAFTPPAGYNLAGDYHIQKAAPFVIGGPPGVGKSRALVALAVAGATGADWFGHPIHRPFRTMILQAENGRVRLKNEFADLNCAALDEFVRVCSPPPFGFAFERRAFRDQLRRDIEKFQPEVFGLDPFNRLARDDKAKDYSQAFEDLLTVLPAGDEAPALGIAAHTRKPRADERASGRALLNLLAGSYVIGSVPRTVFVMQAASDDTEDKRVVWTCCKNNDGELGKRSAWQRRNGLFAPVQDFDWEAFDAEGEKRRIVTISDLETLFQNGQRRIARHIAVSELMRTTTFGKTACYEALNLNGKFSEHLTEQNGLLEFKH